MVTTTYPPSWYLDPMRRHELRYWDGFRWTENVSDAGVPGVDTIFEDTTKPSRYVPPAPPPATTVARDGLGQGGTAADPGDLAQRFPEAGITCRDMDVIYDNRSSKAL